MPKAMLFTSNKHLEVVLDSEMSARIEASAAAVGMTDEQFTIAALQRLVEEQENHGSIVCGKAHTVRQHADAENTQPLTIHLSELQSDILTEAANGYGATLEQACKYGLFNFEDSLDPKGLDGEALLSEIRLLKEPEAVFESRYEQQIDAQLEATEADEKKKED